MNDGKPNEVTKLVIVLGYGDLLRLRWTDDRRPICPICDLIWDRDDEHAWHETGDVNPDGIPLVVPSYGICPCCRTQFGEDDSPDPDQSVEQTWSVLREKWLQR